MYEWGKKIDYTSEDQVSSSYEFKKGEWGRITDLTFHATIPEAVQQGLTEEVFTQRFIQEMSKKGATVKYISVSMTYEYYIHLRYKFTINECIFVGDPIIISTIIVIIIAISGLILSFFLLYPAVVYKLFGVNPQEAIEFNLASLFAPLTLLIGLGLFLYFSASRRKK